MELLAGLLGLVLFALIVRCRVLPYFIRLFTLSSGIAVYAIMQALYTRHALPEEMFGTPGGIERFGLMVASCILTGLLMRLVIFPFSHSDRLNLFHQLGTPLPSPMTHLFVWISGSAVYRMVTLDPSPVYGRYAASRMDLPLLLYVSITMFAFVMWKLREEYARKAISDHPGGEEREAVENAQETSEERALRTKIERLQEEAAIAERRWAAAVLQERAARMQAERSAREFADARRHRDAANVEAPPLTLSEALKILNLPSRYDAVQARTAYHALIRQYHPDKVSMLGPQLRETAERETKKINAAYGMVVREIRRHPAAVG
jgi:DnaJ-domain-containing protein 1